MTRNAFVAVFFFSIACSYGQSGEDRVYWLEKLKILKEYADDVEKQLEGKIVEVNSLLEENNNLESQNEAYYNSIVSLRNSLRGLNERIKELEAALATKDRTIEELRRTVYELQDSVWIMKNNALVQQFTIDTLMNRVRALELENDELKRELFIEKAKNSYEDFLIGVLYQNANDSDSAIVLQGQIDISKFYDLISSAQDHCHCEPQFFLRASQFVHKKRAILSKYVALDKRDNNGNGPEIVFPRGLNRPNFFIYTQYPAKIPNTLILKNMWLRLEVYIVYMPGDGRAISIEEIGVSKQRFVDVAWYNFGTSQVVYDEP